MKNRFVAATLAALGAAALVFAAVAFVAPNEADAQLRGIRRAIQKNTQLAVKRQLARLNIKGSAGPVTAMNVSPDGRYLISVSEDLTPRVWDLQEGRQIIKLRKLAGASHAALFLPDSRSFVTADDSGAVGLWSIPGENKMRDFPGHQGAVTALALSQDGTTMASAGADKTIQVFSVQDGRPIAAFRGLAAGVTALDIGPTGEFLIGGDEAGSVHIWELRTGAEVTTTAAHRGPVRAVRFGIDETEFFSAGDDGAARHWIAGETAPAREYAGTGAALVSLALDSGKDRVAAGAADGGLLVWGTEDSKPTLSLPAHGGALRQVVFDIGGERVLTAGDDAITRIWDLASTTMLVQLISTKGGWATVDEDGRFDGDNKALNDVEWVTDTQALPIDHFSDDYYEPGLLHKKRLGTGDMATAAARTIKDGILPPPTSEITLPGAAASTERLEVSVVTRDQGGGVEEVLLYHNGKIVDRAKKVDEKRATEQELDVLTTTYRVRAVAGHNRFNATAISSEKVLGMYAEAAIEVDIKARPPQLHVLAIGINSYKDKRLDLNYGRPDAQAIATALQQTRGSLFGEVVVHELYDDKATKQGVYAALDALGDTNPEDVVVIYVASHGINLDDEWYMVPHEFTLPLTKDKLREIGVPSLEIRERMAKIEARRTFLMIDACKSGTATTAFEDEIDRRALRRLGRSVGMHVMAATANDQQAVEVNTLGHGVFTYTILAALRGDADTAPADGNVTVQEIVLFAEEEVPSLTQEHAKHKQYPLTFSRGFDFTVSGPKS